jgi:glycosyltransferase involved in cell wall biosynthesis
MKKTFQLTPLVSIITPLYNSEKYISKTVESVIAQTYQVWELIIVDDCSIDNSVEIVDSFIKKEDRIKLIRLKKNSGTAIARNLGIKKARGDYIAFIDSDDLWLPRKLEKQLRFMLENEYPFSYSSYERIDQKGKFLGVVGIPKSVSYRQLLNTCYIGCLTVMLEKAFFDDISFPLIRKRQDFGLWLKLLKEVDKAHGITECLAKYRVHNESISSNKLNSAKHTWILFRVVEKLNLPLAIYYFSQYSIRGFLRFKLPKLAKLLRLL